MSYTKTYSLSLGLSQTGLTLKAQLVDTSNTNVGGLITTGFHEIGAGCYIWTGSVPDGHQGAIVFMDNGTSAVKGIAPINTDDQILNDHVTATVNDVSPQPTSFAGDSTLSGVDNIYKNMVMVMTNPANAALKGISNRITGYTGATKVFTFANAWPITPSNTDKFIIIGRVA